MVIVSMTTTALLRLSVTTTKLCSTSTRRLPSDLLLNKITALDNQTLCSLASLDELREVIHRLSIDRALGMDGYNGGFYRATWPIISSDLLHAINNILRSGKLLNQINHTNLCLVPKIEVPTTVNDFRPIALYNVFCQIELGH